MVATREQLLGELSEIQAWLATRAANWWDAGQDASEWATRAERERVLLGMLEAK